MTKQIIKNQRHVLQRFAGNTICCFMGATRISEILMAKLNIHYSFIIVVLFLLFSCDKESSYTKDKLEVVTGKQFNEFVKKTGYITDAENYGWSIVQLDVYNFRKVEGAYWRRPDGKNIPKSNKLPVTQVSYNDAIAYCEWSKTELPSYNQYWELIKGDNRKVIANNHAPISETDNVNVLGNVWEITSTEKGNEIRLAGGSLFCSSNTCHGTSKERELYADKETSNMHIGFAVIK